MRRVFYLMSGPAHLPYLAASLYTLLQHWSGPVDIHCWPETCHILQPALERYPIAGTVTVWREPDYYGKNDQFLDKQQVAMGYAPDDTVLYLDADTTIHGDLELLFDLAEDYGFCATQFNDWTTGQSRMIRKRIGDLLSYPEIVENIGGWITPIVNGSESVPSVNGGVWAAKPDCRLLPHWYRLTMMATVPRSTFIADEKVLHVLAYLYGGLGEAYTLKEDGRWNCSPKHQPRSLADNKVVVRHYHGDSCCRPAKCKRGVDLWWPVLEACLEANTLGVRDWLRLVWRQNKWLKKLSLPVKNVL